MILTPELMQTMGSGDVPTDLGCVAGYELFLRIVPEPSSHAFAVSALKDAIDAGEVSREHGAVYLKFLHGLQTNPRAIRLGGQYEEVNLWRYKEQEVSSLGALAALKSEVETHMRARPFDYINVIRQVPTETGKMSAPVKAWQQIKPEFEILVFDPETGEHTSPDDVAAEVERVLANEIEHALNESVYRKIRDTQEGFEAWEVFQPT